MIGRDGDNRKSGGRLQYTTEPDTKAGYDPGDSNESPLHLLTLAPREQTAPGVGNVSSEEQKVNSARNRACLRLGA